MQTSHSPNRPPPSSAASSYLQHQDGGEEENESSSSSIRRFGAFLRYVFIRPFCCFPQAAAARPSSLSSPSEDFSTSTCCWYPPILGFSPIFLITVFITIGLSVAAHFYWQPVSIYSSKERERSTLNHKKRERYTYMYMHNVRRQKRKKERNKKRKKERCMQEKVTGLVLD